MLPYRISDVKVFDYQLAGLRTEFIRPSFITFVQNRALFDNDHSNSLVSRCACLNGVAHIENSWEKWDWKSQVAKVETIILGIKVTSKSTRKTFE